MYGSTQTAEKMLRRVVDGGASGWEVTDPHLVSVAVKAA
jgi:predicted aspartyl protease